jgi:hypothetical protein
MSGATRSRYSRLSGCVTWFIPTVDPTSPRCLECCRARSLRPYSRKDSSR